MGCCLEKPINLIRKESKGLSTNRVDTFSKIEDFRKTYEYISTLGAGSFGKVRLFRNKTYKNLKFAIKTLKKEGISKTMYECLIQEINILRSLDHPYIVKYYETYEDDFYINIVMEYLSGDNLYKYITLKKHYNFTEKDMSEIIHLLLKALLFCHNHGIVHRDVKPENILFEKNNDYSTMKLIDFGLATNTHKTDKKTVGSPYYMSPEIIKGQSNSKTDLWSVGIMLHYMLTGKFPFEPDDKNQIFDVITKRKFDSKYIKNCKCSNEAKDLVCKLIIKDVDKRLSAKEALKHPWFKRFEDEEIEEEIHIDHSMIEMLKHFSKKNLFQKEILFFMAKIAEGEEVKKYKLMFNKLDINNLGVLTYEELKEAIIELKLNVTEDELKIIWNGIDFHKDGQVNYTEFLAAMTSSIETNREEKEWSAFKYFEDNNYPGYITYNSLLQTCQAFKLAINEDEIRKTFQKENQEKINFDMFKKLIEEENE